MKLSVVIVNYNVKCFLEQCLRSLLASDISSQMEILVVDNHSSDGSKEYFNGKFPSVTFIWNTENVGYAKANNQAIKKSSGEYILLLNPDTIVGEHVLSNVAKFMDNNADTGIVGVKMINGYGKFLPESKRGFPNPWVSFCKVFGLSKLFPKSRFFSGYHLLFLDENKTHQVDILCGAFMMMRNETLNAIGLLDERFFMYGEDIDLSYRFTLAGYRNYYIPEKIIHYKGESTKKQSMQYVKIFYQAMYLFFKKHYPRRSFWYSLFVPFGIFMRASISVTKRIFSPLINRLWVKKQVKLVKFDIENTSFEEIIDKMDRNKDNSIRFIINIPSVNRGLKNSVHDVKEECEYVVGK